MQSGPGSLVSPVLLTSLSPVWGLELLTTPSPPVFWSTFTHVPRLLRKNVGTVSAGWSQQLALTHFGLVGGLPPQPVIPDQTAPASPQLRHAGWLQVGAGSSEVTVYV